MSKYDSAEEVYNQPLLPTDFSKIKVGLKTLDDAIINLSDFKKVDRRLADKAEVLRAIHNNDYETMREISNFFFKLNLSVAPRRFRKYPKMNCEIQPLLGVVMSANHHL